MADTTKIPERERFSLLYGRQRPPESESKRMRARLGVLISNRLPEDLYEKVRAKLGVPVPVGYHGVIWERFFQEAELRDVLDTITLAYDAIQAGRFTTGLEADRFLREVNLIFQEEHVTYRADNRGVVRFAVDAEFEANRAATLAGLLKQLEAFCDWVDGAHNYRHEHNQEDVIEPPLDVAVLFVSTGAAYIRWLLAIDPQLNKSES